ncbi:hypothetical protein RHS04_02415 [Rhizoctonia solani]|uniref:Transmembrane protein n=1 Tax=Rhizoctonia solani TaxID=456999 RepID=A0A8H7HE77_9AGAM|nr:hypothetical protein RHS04_02415 [Rhizoctonia solani]
MAQRAPLAGRPPYATDEDDSIYDNPAPRARVPRPPVDNPNERTSAYNTYDNYLDGRQSHTSASAGIGGALLAIDSDSDDETDLHSVPPQRNADNGSRAALYAAASGMNNPPPHSSSPNRSPTSPAPPYSPPANGLMPLDAKPTPGMGGRASPGASSSQNPLASPRPVYAPNTPSRQAAFDVHSQQQHPPTNLTVQIPAPPSANLRADIQSRGPTMPTAAFMVPPANGGGGTPSSAGFGPIPGTPNEGLHPHPLQAPSTPITPVFAAPPRVNFAEKSFNTPILRGDKEETLIARRGERGDDFWRRFSMVAKEENAKPANQKSSHWLKRNQAGRSGFSRCVWVVGLILLIVIIGAIGTGYYFSRSKPDHYRPATFGGSEEEGMNGKGTSSVSQSSTSTSTGGLVKIVHTSTSAPAATTTAAAKRSENVSERVIARAFGQPPVQLNRDLPLVTKNVHQHQQSKRRAWQNVI